MYDFRLMHQCASFGFRIFSGGIELQNLNG